LGGGYKLIQKTFGRLKANPMARMPAQAEMAKWILDEGQGIIGKRFFEVGTGHVPVAPIGFFLCGAQSTITVDLHRRIDWGLTRESLEWIANHKKEVFGNYKGVLEKDLFEQRFELLQSCQHDPPQFFKRAGIDYRAPMDAADTQLPHNCIDYHFSITVLEHIPLPVIQSIFLEAKRILKPNGMAVHFVDLSDHFQHTDQTISRINFLCYSETEWNRIAGNEFAYCNRLRVSDYLSKWEEMGFEIQRKEIFIDEQSQKVLQAGFLVDEMFQNYSIDDLCSTQLRIALK
jgi:SAM-dependent methyltransferase